MSEPVKIVIEVTEGYITGVYAPNAEYLVIHNNPWASLPSPVDFEQAEPHSNLREDILARIFP